MRWLAALVVLLPSPVLAMPPGLLGGICYQDTGVCSMIEPTGTPMPGNVCVTGACVTPTPTPTPTDTPTPFPTLTPPATPYCCQVELGNALAFYCSENPCTLDPNQFPAPTYSLSYMRNNICVGSLGRCLTPTPTPRNILFCPQPPQP